MSAQVSEMFVRGVGGAVSVDDKLYVGATGYVLLFIFLPSFRPSSKTRSELGLSSPFCELAL